MQNFNKKVIQYLIICFCFIFITSEVFAQGASCASAEQYCDDVNCGSYPAATTGGNDPCMSESSTCIGGDPRPAWYYLIADATGTLTLNISNTPAVDTDFAAWGPFATVVDAQGACAGADCTGLSTGNQVGCDYSGSAGGSISTTANAGEVFLFVITNFGGTPTDITVTSSGTSGPSCCPVATQNPDNIFICSGDAIPALSLTDFEGTAGDVANSNPYIADLGLSSSQTAFVAPVAADFINQTCAPIIIDLYYFIDCDSDCDATGDTAHSIGSVTVTIYPDPALQVTETTSNGCGEAASVIINSADGSEQCFTDSGAVPAPPAICGTTDDQTLTYTYTINGGETCEAVFTNTLPAICPGEPCCDAETGSY